MALGLIIFGVFSGSLLSILAGLIGSRRKIGFGWTFLLSLLFTPLIGLLAALISGPLPPGVQRWGCIAPLLVFITAALVVVTLMTLLFGSLLAL